MNLSACLALATSMTLAGMWTHVSAVEIERTDYQSAAGLCQSALPATATSLRSRPLGMANEGTQTLFVTCAVPGSNSSRGATAVFLRLGNTSASAFDATCTLVNGFGGSNSFTPVYLAQTQSVPANGGRSYVWVPADLGNGSAVISFPQVSCALPPRAVIFYISHDYREEVLN